MKCSIPGCSNWNSNAIEPCIGCRFPVTPKALATGPRVALNERPEQGDRHNDGKLRMDLLPFAALHEVANVLTFGANKYSDRNWEKGLSYMETVGSLLRHVGLWVLGQQNDPESGLHHMAHAAFNCLALVEFAHTGRGTDDRPYRQQTDRP